MRILLVEDDLSIAEPLVAGLVRNGFEVDHTMGGLPGVQRAPGYDLLLLDLGCFSRGARKSAVKSS